MLYDFCVIMLYCRNNYKFLKILPFLILMIKTTAMLNEQVDFHLDVSSYSINLCVSECKYSIYSRYTLRKWNLH